MRSIPPTGQPRASRWTLQPVDRRIMAMAVPALGALVAEPLFVLADSAVVARLGPVPLAGLSAASTILLTVVGLCIFLAYSTTTATARAVGAGHRDEAISEGWDGVRLAAALGVVLGVGLWVAAPWLVRAVGAHGAVAAQAEIYLQWSAPGLVGMLVVLATTGMLRGLLDAKAPLGVVAAGALLNAIGSVVLVHPVGMGIAGSGLATAVTQTLQALALITLIRRRHAAAGRRPTAAESPAGGRPTAAPWRGLLRQAVAGAPLLLRTVWLRAALVITTMVAANAGTTPLAAHQLVSSVWSLVALGLDSLAIAAQSLIGHALGAGDRAAANALLRRTLGWGVVAAVVVMVVLVTTAGAWVPLLVTDPAVRTATLTTLRVAALLLPIAGVAWVLDGVLIGAGDARFLAVAGFLTLLAYAPVAWAVDRWASPDTTLTWLWVGFGGLFMLARVVVTGWRAAGDAWQRIGA